MRGLVTVMEYRPLRLLAMNQVVQYIKNFELLTWESMGKSQTVHHLHYLGAAHVG